MNLIKSASALLLLASSSAVFAANLSIPMSFEYLALDGQTIETNKFTHKKDLTLTNGTHKIAIRYHDIVNDEFSDSQSFIKSAPFIVTLVVDGDHQYLLSPAQGVVKQPKSFAKAPQIIISREDKQAADFSVAQTQLEESSFFGKLFADKSQPAIAASTQVAATTPKTETAQPPASNKQTPEQTFTDKLASQTQAITSDSLPDHDAVNGMIAATPAKAEAKINTKSNSKAQAEQMLQYWWLQADDKTRKAFMGWAIQQL
jgi:uncharacterized protein YccT (UPF0319 family)